MTPAEGPSVAPAEVAAAAAMIDATDLDDSETIAALQGIRFTDAGTAAARAAIEGGAKGDELWAATWVYASFATDPEPLLAPLGADDPSTRLMAAAGLVSLGRLEGFDVLVGELSSPDWLAGSHPPTTIARFAAHTLERYTGVDLGLDPSATPEAVATAWAAWLETSRDRITFEPETATWSVR
ncbi:MAG TPA: hypothetical protein VLS28_11390 [Candidatus Sulfomarinibacteraceae bacterium]|nr:hypothetical protein [Candidatus Sulfomarinibacteraceae bacterium]